MEGYVNNSVKPVSSDSTPPLSKASFGVIHKRNYSKLRKYRKLPIMMSPYIYKSNKFNYFYDSVNPIVANSHNI